ncbi:MAG: chemotaxis protein CheX [Phycisphaerales bacterium]
MEPDFITPMIASTRHVFNTLMQLSILARDPCPLQRPGSVHDVSGITGLSGDVTGAIIFSLPLESARQIVRRFAGQNLEPDHPDFCDAIGELTNMIAGGTKGLMGGRRVQISCPTVILGPGHIVSSRRYVSGFAVPCVTDCGELTLGICVTEHAPAPASRAARPGSVPVS